MWTEPLGALLTLVFVAAALVFIIFRIRAASKAAAEREKEKKQKDKERREIAQQELLDSLNRVKDPGKLEAAKRAIQRDPKRAARVVSRMMRDSGKSE